MQVTARQAKSHYSNTHAWLSVYLYSRHVHAVTCAGMLPSQFMNFCKFAEMGEVKQQYISSGRSLRYQ